MGKDLNGKELGKNLSQRKDGLYEAKYTDNFGKRHSIYAKKLSEIRKKLNEALYAKEHNIFNPNCKLTLNEWFDQWIETFYKNTVKPVTYIEMKERYDRAIRNSKIGNMDITTIRNAHIQDVINELIESRNLQRRAAVNYLEAIKMPLQKAYECEYVASNPVKHINLPKDDIKTKHPLSHREQELFLAYSKTSSYYNLFVFLLNTGVRINEALALTWDDIDFDNRTVLINKSLKPVAKSNSRILENMGCAMTYNDSLIITTPKTKRSIRNLPMTEECYRLLLKMAQKDNTGIVFKSTNGKYIWCTNVRIRIKEICEKINKESGELIRDITPHTFRHTFTTRCLESKLDIKTTQYLLGHSHISTTMQVYTHLTEEYLKTEIKSLNIT